jgi:hypothetical protein
MHPKIFLQKNLHLVFFVITINRMGMVTSRMGSMGRGRGADLLSALPWRGAGFFAGHGTKSGMIVAPPPKKT